MNQKKVMIPLRDKPYGGAWGIKDEESVKHLASIKTELGDRKKFLADYKEWFTRDRTFEGIGGFQNIDFSAGTTETFGYFYLQHMDRRLRLYKAEYFYHWVMARNYFKKSAELGAEPLTEGDVVVMSCPFSGTGKIPKDFYKILEQCDQLSIPVMLDLAYISISDIKELDLNHKCIHTITTSLSKVFPVENHRIGMRMTRDFYDDALVAYNQNQYVNLHSINVGQKLIEKFDNDWIFNKYRQKQAETCERLGVDVSDCVIFGLDSKNKFNEYNRGGEINRLCFSRVWDGRVKISP